MQHPPLDESGDDEADSDDTPGDSLDVDAIWDTI